MAGEHKVAADAPASPFWRTVSALEWSLHAFMIVYVAYYRGDTFLWRQWEEMNAKNPYGLLSEGWIPGRRVRSNDHTDLQWRMFRANILLFIVAASVYLVLSHLVRYLTNDNKRVRIYFYALSGVAFIYGTCEYQVIFPLVILLVNFAIAKTLRGSILNPLVTWLFNLTSLYFMDAHPRFDYYHPSLTFLDAHKGFLDWNNVVYIIFLRFISFNMDYYWTLNNRISAIKFTAEDRETMTYTYRQETNRPLEDYSLVNLIAYVFYAPLWVCGPIASFNAWVSQVEVAQKEHSRRDLLLYVMRFFLVLFIKEVMDHFLYVDALNYRIFSTGEWRTWNMLDFAMLPYWSVKLVYLRLLLLWRFPRMWSLLDGVNVPDNMNRCMSNNYTVEGFWRSWHRSFNQWLLRYIYIPLGGSRSGLLRHAVNVFMVFTFVIIAHAPQIWKELNFLVWGWGMALFIVPEIVAKYVTSFAAFEPLKRSPYWRHIVSVAGAFNIIILITANLIGYGMKLSRHSHMTAEMAVLDVYRKLFVPFNWEFFLVVGVVLFSATQIMLAIRRREQRVYGKQKAY